MNRLHRQSVTTVPSDVSAQESLCAALLAHSPDVMFRLDHALRFVYVNPAVTRWTGLKPEAFHGKTGVEAGLREWVWAQLAEKCREALASGKIAHTEFSDNTPQGLLHFEARLIPEFGDDGRVATLLGIVTDITDSWRMQSALRDSEIHFHLLADYAPGIVWISSAEGNVEYVNHRFFEVTGLSAAAPLKDNWAAAIHPDDQARMQAHWANGIRTGAVCSAEFRQRCSAGGYRWQLGRAQPTRDAQGRIVRWITTVIDIDDVKCSAEALRLSEESLALAKDAAGFGLYDHDLRSGESRWDEHARALLGIDGGPPLTRNGIAAYVHPLDREARVASIERALDPGGDGRIYTEYRTAPRPGVAVRWLAGSGRVQFEQGRALRIVGLLRDITEQKLAQERALLEKDELLSLAEAAGNAGSFEWLVPSNTLRLSPRLLALYGIPSFDGNRDTWWRLVHPDDLQTVRLRLADVFARGKTSYEHEYRVVRPDGRLCWVQSHFNVCYDNQRRPLRVIGQNVDITAHKVTEQRLIESNENLQRATANQTRLIEEERSRIARNLHDGVGQLLYLAGIRLASAMNLAKGKPLRATLEEVVGVIGQANRDIRSIEFEMSPPQLRQFGLLSALSWLSEDMQQRFGLRVTVTDDTSDKPLDSVISAILYRAVRELLINVSKHAQVDAARVAVRRIECAIEITVSDRGVGLRGRELFSSSTGMGLRGVREALLSSGGNIVIISPEEGGTVATLTAQLALAPTDDFAREPRAMPHPTTPSKAPAALPTTENTPS